VHLALAWLLAWVRAHLVSALHQESARRASARERQESALRRPIAAARSIVRESVEQALRYITKEERMIGRCIAVAALLTLAISSRGYADTAAANSCAAKLPKDAKTIFDTTLPKVTPGADLRELLTTNTRSLAISGAVARSTARDSATAAAQCLRLVNS
jgi:hypothetical protein